MEIDGERLGIPGIAPEAQNDSGSLKRPSLCWETDADKFPSGGDPEREPLGSGGQKSSSVAYRPPGEQQPILRERDQDDYDQIESDKNGGELHD